LTISPNSAVTWRQEGLAVDDFPWRILFLAWLIFLASRLAIVLQGGTALESRLNYGAAAAVALAAAALARWAWHRWLEKSVVLRWLAIAGFVGSIALMSLAIAGRALHFALSSQAEAYTITTLAQEVAKHPTIRSIVIVGTPVPDIGELNYFDDGYVGWRWLPTVLARLGYKGKAWVTRSKDRPYPKADAVFVWSGTWPQARLVRSGS
jgi:hypothetical protein